MILNPIPAALVKELSSLKLKKYRQKYDKFVVEGHKLVDSLLQFPDWKVEAVLWENNLEISPSLQKGIQMRSVPIYSINQRQSSQISALKTPPGIYALCKYKSWPWVSFESKGFLFCLSGIKDPGNLGTMLRIADWFGADGVLCTPDCVDIQNQKVVQSSMGSIFKVPVWYMEASKILCELGDFDWYLADVSGTPVQYCQWSDRSIVVIGSESHGISDIFKNAKAKTISIPGSVGRFSESLNAAVAAAVIAHHWNIR